MFEKPTNPLDKSFQALDAQAELFAAQEEQRQIINQGQALHAQGEVGHRQLDLDVDFAALKTEEALRAAKKADRAAAGGWLGRLTSGR